MKLPASSAFIIFATISLASAAPVFQADPNSEGVTTDAWDIALGARVIYSSPQLGCCGGSDPRSAFGFTTTSGWVEPTHAIWQDGSSGVTDFLEWQTPQPIDLSGISLHLADDGSANRSALDFKLFASQDGVNFSQISAGVIPANAGGYLNKSADPDDMVAAVRKVAAGGMYVTPATAEEQGNAYS